jgi:hypothetical protein
MEKMTLDDVITTLKTLTNLDFDIFNNFDVKPDFMAGGFIDEDDNIELYLGSTNHSFDPSAFGYTAYHVSIVTVNPWNELYDIRIGMRTEPRAYVNIVTNPKKMEAAAAEKGIELYLITKEQYKDIKMDRSRIRLRTD